MHIDHTNTHKNWKLLRNNLMFRHKRISPFFPTCPYLLHVMLILSIWSFDTSPLHLTYATEHIRPGPERRTPPTHPPTCEGSDCSLNRNDNVNRHPCNCRYKDYPEYPQPEGARLAYLIVIHNNRTMEDAVNLIRAIRSPQTIVVIHIDTKLDWDVYESSNLLREIDDCSCGTEFLVDSVHDAEWGEWSMNDPTHWGMDVLVSNPRFRNKWDVFINLSGDTMPVLTPHVMSQLFDPYTGPLGGINFVTSIVCETGFIPTDVYLFPPKWHKREAYTHNPKEMPTIHYVDDDGEQKSMTMTAHFGSQWMTLQSDFVTYLVKSLKREDSLPSRYRDELIQTGRMMTDETFIPTILMHVPPFNQTLPKELENGNLEVMPSMYAIRYERMDEHCPTAAGYFPTEQRYEVPESSVADQPKIWGPYFLGVYDLANIKRSGALFVRKVSVFVDPNIVNMLPVDSIDSLPDIGWPKEVKLSKVPNWEKIKAELTRRALEKMKKKKEKKEKMQKEKKNTVEVVHNDDAL